MTVKPLNALEPDARVQSLFRESIQGINSVHGFGNVATYHNLE